MMVTTFHRDNNTQPQGTKCPSQYRLREQQNPSPNSIRKETKHDKRVTFEDTLMVCDTNVDHTHHPTHKTKQNQHDIPRRSNAEPKQQHKTQTHHTSCTQVCKKRVGFNQRRTYQWLMQQLSSTNATFKTQTPRCSIE